MKRSFDPDSESHNDTKRYKDDENAESIASNDEEEEEGEPLTNRVRQTDIRVLTAMKDKLDGETINRDVEKIRQQYLINYMKTVIEKLPLSQHLIDTRNMELNDVDEYLKMFSIARTCVHTQMQVQKLDTFNAIFDMMTRLVGKGIHDRVITPYLQNVVSKHHLDVAYASFQDALSDKGDESHLCTELHCVTYLIQTEMEKSRPLKIPNPIFNRFAQQLKAGSRYVTTILSALASQPLMPRFGTRKNTDNTGAMQNPPSPIGEDEREYEFFPTTAATPVTSLDREGERARELIPTIAASPLPSPDEEGERAREFEFSADQE